MNLLDRFSSHLREVLARSIQLATELKNYEVEPVHLLFCLANQKGSVAAEIIARFALDLKTLEQAVTNLPALPTSEKSAAYSSSAPTLQNILTPLSNTAKITLERALMIAQENDHNYIGTEHLLAALLRANYPFIAELFKTSATAMKEDEAHKQLEAALANASRFPHLITDISEMLDGMQENFADLASLDRPNLPLEKNPAKNKKKKDSALDFFATELTGKEAQKQIDPVIGRDQEIERVIQIICRRTKNNPLLLGDPGVGKTAIVEGLAKKIVEGKVPEALFGKKIYALDMGLLISGTIYRGEFEARLRQVVEEVSGNQNIILFIDEIHNIVGAGSNQGTLDAANLLKPALARGKIRCIGATTPGEFKKYIENDAALERRFQPIIVKAPSTEDAIAILAGIKTGYENYHRVTITAGAIAAAVRLSDRYLTNKFLPDKAIDLLDETAAAKRLGVPVSAAGNKLWRLEQKIDKIVAAKEEAARQEQFSQAVAFKKEGEYYRAELAALKEKRQGSARPNAAITERDVAEQLAKIIGAKPSDLLAEDSADLRAIEDSLLLQVVGQNEVIAEVAQLIRQARLGLSRADRPLASFLFAGESGVGKTELAKSLAKTLYPNQDALIKLDMSEFNESFSVSKLLGSPAGYVGYREGNQFTDRVKLNPHAVILFDEIDKAHRDVAKLLLQMLEDGELTDAAGKKVSLRHAIIILTTSLGSSELQRGAIGFGGGSGLYREKKARVIDKLKEHFSPELINRLDQVCIFQPLTAAALQKIAELELGQLNERLAEYRTSIHPSQGVLAWIVNHQAEGERGARELRRYLRSQVEGLVAGMILRQKIKRRYQLTLTGEKLRIE